MEKIGMANQFSIYIPDDVIGGRGIADSPLVRVHDCSDAGLLRFPTATCPSVVLHNATHRGTFNQYIFF